MDNMRERLRSLLDSRPTTTNFNGSKEEWLSRIKHLEFTVERLRQQDIDTLKSEFDDLRRSIENIESYKPRGLSMNESRLAEQIQELVQENEQLHRAIHRKTHCSACDRLLKLGYSTRYCVSHGGKFVN